MLKMMIPYIFDTCATASQLYLPALPNLQHNNFIRVHVNFFFC